MIFISHTEKDRDSADALAAFLAESIAIPPGALKIAGDRSPRDLKARIGDSDVILALVPPESLRSNWVIFELGAAWAMDKLLFLFFMPGIDFRDLPEPLSNYPSVDALDPHAHITIVDMARDIADFLDVAERKSAGVLPALERLLDTLRNIPAEEAPDDDDDLPQQAPARMPALPRIETLPDGRGFTDISLDYQVVLKGTVREENTAIRVAWEDLFKSIAPNLNTPQDDEYIQKLILEFCKEKSIAFGEASKSGIYRAAVVTRASYSQIVQRFSGLGYITTARAPHSIFQKQTGRVYWKITPKGEEYLRNTLLVRKSLQEWTYKQKHIPRSTYRDREPGPRYQ